MNERIAIEDRGTIIPHHVIYEILARLPLKSLMRFKAVSKEWLYTIQDQEFSIHRSRIHTAAAAAAAAAPTCLISFKRPNGYYSIDLDSGLATPFENLNQPEFEGAEFFNTAMGLTCFEAKGITYFWNPSTREITALPQTEPDFPVVNSDVQSYSSLGFDPVKGQYKVLKIWTVLCKATLPRKICHKVITLGTSEWRRIDDGIPMGVFVGPVFVDGKLHYLTVDKLWKEIRVVFDVGTEKFEVIEIPKQAKGSTLHLIPYRDCLSFVKFHYNRADEVVMAVRVLDGWKWVVKKVTLQGGWGRELPGFTMGNLRVTGISTGEILVTKLLSSGQFYVYRYDMEKMSMKEVEIHGLPHGMLNNDVACPPVEYGESILSLKKFNLH